MARNQPYEPDAPNSGIVLGMNDPRQGVEPDGRKFIRLDSGEKFYPLPDDQAWMRKDGGVFHNPDTWNPKTGKWEPGGVNWQTVGIWLAGATIGGYAAAAYSPVASTVSTAASASGGAGTGGAGAALGPSTAANMAATTAASTAVPSGIAAGTGTGAGVAGATGWIGKNLGWGNLVGLGTGVLGQYLQNRALGQATDKQIAASERAAEIQAQSARDQLDFVKSAYNREQEQLAPYVGAGGSAVTKLSQLMGLGTPAPYVPIAGLQPSYNPNAPQGPNQAPIPAAPGVNRDDPRLGPGPSTVGQLAGTGGSGLVLMQAPDGSRRPVPKALVAQATAKGAQVVGNA